MGRDGDPEVRLRGGRVPPGAAAGNTSSGKGFGRHGPWMTLQEKSAYLRIQTFLNRKACLPEVTGDRLKVSMWDRSSGAPLRAPGG